MLNVTHVDLYAATYGYDDLNKAEKDLLDLPAETHTYYKRFAERLNKVLKVRARQELEEKERRGETLFGPIIE